MRSKVCLIIVLVMLLGIQGIGRAGDSPSDADLRITVATLTTERSSGDSVVATAKIEANMVMDSIGVKSLVIQENDGSGWQPVKGPVTDLKVSVRNNTVTLSFTGTPGYRYRAKGTLYAAKSGYPTYSDAKTSNVVTR